MQVSFNNALDDNRVHHTIGRVKAVGRWRGANEPNLDADRQSALRALVREAEEYGADALIDVRFEIDDCARADIDGVCLRRIVAIGSAVRFALAA